MKSILLIATALLSLSAQATQVSIRHLDVVSADFNPMHAKKPGPATIDIDYANKQVTLHVVREYYCPPGAACAMVMPMPLEVVLPITSIKAGPCGISTITAMKDARPFDGQFEQITVEDFSHLTCKFFVQYMRKATYLTKNYNRIQGGEQVAVSTMTLQEAKQVSGESSSRSFNLVDGRITKGSTARVPANGKLELSEKTVSLQIDMRMNCKADQICAQNLIALRVTLPIQSIEKSNCGDKIVAFADGMRDGRGLERIELMDYSNATCDRVIPFTVVGDYSYQNGKTDTRMHLDFVK